MTAYAPIPVVAASRSIARKRYNGLRVIRSRAILSAVDDSGEMGWCDEQRSIVINYLAQQGVACGQVGKWPAWHIQPYVAVWAVESAVRPGWVGWWAISGDLPTDYVSCGPERHPRAGLRGIAERWREAAQVMADGKELLELSVGSRQQQGELAPLLAASAEQLLSFVADDGLWID